MVSGPDCIMQKPSLIQNDVEKYTQNLSNITRSCLKLECETAVLFLMSNDCSRSFEVMQSIRSFGSIFPTCL
jgi:hypothetical protein